MVKSRVPCSIARQHALAGTARDHDIACCLSHVAVFCLCMHIYSNGSAHGSIWEAVLLFNDDFVIC